MDAGGIHLLVEDARDGVREALELSPLLCEGLDHAHAGDVFLGLRREFGDPLLRLLERRPGAAPVAARDHDHERNRRQRERGEPGPQREHRYRSEHDRERRLPDEDQPVAEEEAHRLQVDGDARHQLAGLLAVEERQLEPLEVLIEPVAQIELDFFRQDNQ